MPPASCPNCGAELRQPSRFCPECGVRLEEGSTAVEEVPLDETGRVPANVLSVEPRYFGLTPPILVFSLAAVALAVAVVLLVSGHWILGAVCLVASLLLGAGFLDVAARKPDGSVARASVRLVVSGRARAGYAVELVSLRSRAAREATRLRGELLEAESSRRERLLALGEAAYRDDPEGTERLREALRDIDDSIARKEERMRAIATEVEQRIARAQFQVRPTLVQVPEPSPQPVPEPYPPPDELTPPEPAQVPEPSPPPDEITPPLPAPVPEPGPGGPSQKA